MNETDPLGIVVLPHSIPVIAPETTPVHVVPGYLAFLRRCFESIMNTKLNSEPISRKKIKITLTLFRSYKDYLSKQEIINAQIKHRHNQTINWYSWLYFNPAEMTLLGYTHDLLISEAKKTQQEILALDTPLEIIEFVNYAIDFLTDLK